MTAMEGPTGSLADASVKLPAVAAAVARKENKRTWKAPAPWEDTDSEDEDDTHAAPAAPAAKQQRISEQRAGSGELRRLREVPAWGSDAAKRILKAPPCCDKPHGSPQEA